MPGMNRLAVRGMKRQSLSKPDFRHPALRDRASRMWGMRGALDGGETNPSHASLQVTRHVFPRSRLKGGGGVPRARLGRRRHFQMSWSWVPHDNLGSAQRPACFSTLVRPSCRIR